MRKVNIPPQTPKYNLVVLGSLEFLEACNVNVAGSGVLFYAIDNFVGFWGGPERPRDAIMEKWVRNVM